MDITFPFLHLCTQSVLARGKVSHQYILQLHSSHKLGEIINTTAQWGSLCRNQFSQVAMAGNCLLQSIIGCLQVLLFVNFHICNVSSKCEIRDSWKISHILARRVKTRKKKAWWELIFPYWIANRHTHYCWTTDFHLLIHTANNRDICH